jgi:hypothetical protein
MKRLGLFSIFFVIVSSAACGGGSDKTEPDMSACGAKTCSAITAFNPKTCQCEPADMTMTGTPMDMTMLGD